MSWITAIWAAVASACLTLAAVHLMVWCRRRKEWGRLLFCFAATGTAGMAFFELLMMKAQRPEQLASAMRWDHIPVWMMVVFLVGFVRVELRAGRRSLAWTIAALRTIALPLNFVVGQNLNYREAAGPDRVMVLGELVLAPAGTPNPWAIVGHLSLLLLLVFVVDAAITVWRRDERMRAMATCGGIVLCVVAGVAQVVLVNWNILRTPVTVSFFFLGIVAAMAWELSRDAASAGRLSARLHETEVEMALAAETTGVGVWVWNAADDRVRGTEHWLGLFGFSPDTPVTFGQVLQRIHPDDREVVKCDVQRSLSSHSDYRGDFRLQMPEGRVRWIVSRGRVFQEATGKASRMLGTAIDITLRKEAEESLRESQARIESAVEAASLGFYEFEFGSRLVFADARTRDMFGLPPDAEATAETFWLEHIHPEYIPDIQRQSQEMREGKFSHGQTEYLYKHPSRGMRWFRHLYRVRTRDPAGRPFRVLGVVQDITDRKQAELESQRARDDLVHMARVSMMGELSASLAHELSRPLTAILSNAQAAQHFIAKDNPDLAELREILDDIVADNQRAGEVIHRVRTLLKKDHVSHCPLDVNDVVQDVLKLVRNDLMNHKVTLQTALASDQPIVEGDRVQLQQVILNLLANAIDAMAHISPSKRRLLVQTERTETRNVRISVVDRGTGLAPEAMAMLFTPFFTTKPTGMGMGLRISRTIIDAHGGSLGFKNNPEGGATFHFTLPVSAKDQS